MRYFYCRPGTKYEGEHKIYDNKAEFEKHEPQAKLYRWARDSTIVTEMVTGEWVEAEDGYIVQLLARGYVKSRNGYSVTETFRFPMGTFGVARRKDGTFKFPHFYAQFTNGDKSSLSGKTRSSRMGDFPKVRFAAMVCGGMAPHMAFRSNFQEGKRFLTQFQIEKKILRLFMDPVVRDEINRHVIAFKDKIKDQITLDMIVERIIQHWNNVKPGTKQDQNAIEMLMEIHDVMVIDDTTKRKKIINKVDDADEAEYRIENNPAPELGMSDD